MWRLPLAMKWFLKRTVATAAVPALRVSPVKLSTGDSSSRASTSPPLWAIAALSSRKAQTCTGSGWLEVASRVPVRVPRYVRRSWSWLDQIRVTWTVAVVATYNRLAEREPVGALIHSTC